MTVEQSPASETGGWATVLPESWWRIPLTDAVARTGAIKRIVQEQFGYADGDASLKRRTRSDLLAAATAAHAAGGLQMALAHMDVAGVMVTATMVVYEIAMPSDGDDTVERFFSEVAAGFGPEAEVLRGEVSAGRVLRAVRATEVVRPDAEPSEMPELPELRADYWVALEGASSILLFVFTSPFVPLREGLVDLFDAVVESLHEVSAE